MCDLLGKELETELISLLSPRLRTSPLKSSHTHPSVGVQRVLSRLPSQVDKRTTDDFVFKQQERLGALSSERSRGWKNRPAQHFESEEQRQREGASGAGERRSKWSRREKEQVEQEREGASGAGERRSKWSKREKEQVEQEREGASGAGERRSKWSRREKEQEINVLGPLGAAVISQLSVCDRLRALRGPCHRPHTSGRRDGLVASDGSVTPPQSSGLCLQSLSKI
ncbi:unnamed protein product [Pleuronectes platessa]|uniref:Uncharacterized protein n=1 Tax=Pleuronectes platessa TaxID=8262 RepID=A0A9N7UMG3_PLEPL|nr:unnamed protein product [Pleuronectes platessa]